ncbi:MAG TPA: MFS transporter [Fimbriimonadaceae bacterium]|nr:MFS transporter [Fimbriimonadaceae bacterium]
MDTVEKENMDPLRRESLSIPTVRSPYEGRLSGGQQFAISAYWFATNFLWGALLVIMLPAEVKTLFPEYRVPALGYLIAFGAVAAIFVPLIVGAMSDRCVSRYGRRRPYIVAGVLINLVGLAAMCAAVTVLPVVHGDRSDSTGKIAATLFTSPTFLLLLVAYLIAQFGNNIASAAYSGVIPDVVPEDQRGTASGWMALMSQLGTLFGAVGCGILLGRAPETFKYIVLCIVLAGVGAITVFGIKENPLPAKPEPISWSLYFKSLWINPREYPDFAWVWITRAFVMLGFYAVLPFINYYLMDVVNIPEAKVGDMAGKLIAVILLTSSISGIYGGAISDRIGRKKVVYIANTMIAVVTAVFVFCSSFWQVVALGTLFGFGFGAYTSVDWALGTDVLPSKKDAAKEMAVWHVAMTLPQSIAPPIAGFIIALFGFTTVTRPDETIYHYTHTGYGVTFAMCALLFGMGAFFLKNVRGVR